MISIYWVDVTFANTVSLEKIKEKLSAGDRKRYGKIFRNEDRIKFLSGRYLLHYYLQKNFPKASLNDVTRDSYKRPFIPQCGAFSISHAANIVAVAFSMVEDSKIGFDIEKEENIELEDYLIAFSEEERTHIQNHPQNASKEFLKLWTKKESLYKALGTGFLKEPSTITVLKKQLSFSGKTFYFRHPEIHPKMLASLCCDHSVSFSLQNVRIV